MPKTILQVNTADQGGGADQVAYNLHRGGLSQGLDSYMAVGRRRRDDARIFQISHAQAKPIPVRLALGIANRLEQADAFRGSWRGAQWLRKTAEPIRHQSKQRGHEDFHYPGTSNILSLPPHRPQVIHAHNLHGGYFDLRQLPAISQSVPTLLTLHDAWMMSGHCAHSMGCDRWRSGCGDCPDLSLYPAIEIDATAENYALKKRIYEQSRFAIATPSQWLMDKVQQSILQPAVTEARVIPNGIDLDVFRPMDRDAIRRDLGLPSSDEASILMFAANGIRQSVWKNFRMMREAVERLANDQRHKRILFLAVGSDEPDEKIGPATIRFVPYQSTPQAMAAYYQAADVYVHAAKADTFPNCVIEAMACGTPVVATAVGGIPEQIVDGDTGFLIPPDDASSMANRIGMILNDSGMSHGFSESSAKRASLHYNLTNQIETYCDWYETIAQASPQKAEAAA